MRFPARLVAALLVLGLAGCTGKGNVQQKVYLNSDNTSKAFIGYQFPTNK